MYILLSIIMLIFMAIYCKKHNQKQRVCKKKRIPRLHIERCDVQYYLDVNKEYNKRKRWYQASKTEAPGEVPEQYQNIQVDSQNVHDTLINTTLKKVYENIGKFPMQNDNFLDNFDQKQQNILKKIQDRNALLVKQQDTEWNVIKNVWNSLDTDGQNNFKLQIHDCLDQYGMLYCPTGIVNRVLSIKLFHDPEKLKTRDMMNSEILAKFSKLSETGTSNSAIKELVLADYPIEQREIAKSIIEEWEEFL